MVQTSKRSFKSRRYRPQVGRSAKMAAHNSVRYGTRKGGARAYAKPARFRQGAKTTKPQKRLLNNLVKSGVLEVKQKEGIAFNEQALTARCSNNIQYINFTPARTNTASTAENAKLLGLTTIAKGTDANQYVGKYIHVKNAFLRFHIMCPPIDEGTTNALENYKGMTHRKLRVLLVAPKLAVTPVQQIPSTDSSLFLDYAGAEYGLVNTLDKPDWEIMAAPINKKNWIVYKDKTITVSPSRVDTYDSNSRPALKDHNLSGETYYSASWNVQHQMKTNGASELNINCSLPVNKKVAMSSDEPQDMNLAYRFIIISSIPGMKQADTKTTNAAAYGTNRVLVSSRSFIQFVDA